IWVAPEERLKNGDVTPERPLVLQLAEAVRLLDEGVDRELAREPTRAAGHLHERADDGVGIFDDEQRRSIARELARAIPTQQRHLDRIHDEGADPEGGLHDGAR